MATLYLKEEWPEDEADLISAVTALAKNASSPTDSLQSQNDTLTNARSTMVKTESVALEITKEFGRHRISISSARGRVWQVTGMTNRVRRIVQIMS